MFCSIQPIANTNWEESWCFLKRRCGLIRPNPSDTEAGSATFSALGQNFPHASFCLACTHKETTPINEMQMKCRINNILSIKYKAISSKIFPNLTPILWSFQVPYSNYTHCTLFSTLHVDDPEYFHQKVPMRTIHLLLYRFGKNQALVTPSEGAFLIPLETPFL